MSAANQIVPQPSDAELSTVWIDGAIVKSPAAVGNQVIKSPRAVLSFALRIDGELDRVVMKCGDNVSLAIGDSAVEDAAVGWSFSL